MTNPLKYHNSGLRTKEVGLGQRRVNRWRNPTKTGDKTFQKSAYEEAGERLRHVAAGLVLGARAPMALRNRPIDQVAPDRSRRSKDNQLHFQLLAT